MTTVDQINRARVEHAKAVVAVEEAKEALQRATRARFATAQRVNGPFPLTVVLEGGKAVTLLGGAEYDADERYTARRYTIGQAVSE